MYPHTKQLILKKMEERFYPGVAITFIKENQIEAFTAGLAQIVPEKRLMTEDLLFDAASLAKVVATTSLVLRLLEDGKAELDQPLHKYLPEFENQTITLRHLLTYTSDIKTWIPNRGKLSQEESIVAYLKLEPGEQLGKEIRYTDAGTILLGSTLEEIYQETAAEIFQEQVLEPLGMMDSLFLPFPSKKIVPTERLPSGEVLRRQIHDPKARVLAEHVDNASLSIDLKDSVTFVQTYLNKGEIRNDRFLEEETIDSLLQDQTPKKNGYRSLGWDLKKDVEDGHAILFHTGHTSTLLLIDIKTQEALISLPNRVHPIDHRAEYLIRRDEVVENFSKEKTVLPK